MNEVQKLELDAEALLKQVEDFFEHLIHHTSAEKHFAITAAQGVVKTAVNPTPAAPVAAAALILGPTTSFTVADVAGTTASAGETGST